MNTPSISIKAFKKLLPDYTVVDRNHNGQLDPYDQVFRPTEGNEKVSVTHKQAVDAFEKAKSDPKNVDRELDNLRATFMTEVAAANSKFMMRHRSAELYKAFDNLKGGMSSVNEEFASEIGAFIDAAKKKQSWRGEVKVLNEAVPTIEARFKALLDLPHPKPRR